MKNALYILRVVRKLNLIKNSVVNEIRRKNSETAMHLRKLNLLKHSVENELRKQKETVKCYIEREEESVLTQT